MFLPEASRIPTANEYPAGRNTLSDIIVPSRAIENNVYVAYANFVQTAEDAEEYIKFYGESVVCC